MRITDISLRDLRIDLDPPFHAAWDPVPRKDFAATVVQVRTDEGITGVGSGDRMTGFAEHEQHFLGTDPLRIARQVEVIESIGFHHGRFWPLEAALWDIVGQVAGLPVATLFGGAAQRLPVYASWGAVLPPRQRAEDAHALLDKGFRAVKLRVQPARAAEGMAALRAVREAVGDRLDVLVDLNQSWRMAGDVTRPLDPAAARSLVAELAELDVFWVEEPLPYDDVDGLRALRADNPGVRVAAGEMLDSMPRTLALLEADALDVYQADVVLALGMSRARTLAELARLRNRAFTPHTWTNGIGLLANLHVAAGVGAGPYLEFPYDPSGGWTPERRDFPLVSPLWPEADGCLAVPKAPGLGIELRDDLDRLTR